MRIAMLCGVLLMTMTGCATLDTVKSRASQLAQAAQQHAHIVYARQQRYLAEHEVLKGFEDASEHSESEVLKVLHGARAKSTATTDGNARGSASASAVHVHANAHAPTLATNPPALQGDGSYHWPVEAGVISSEYGARWGKLHKGIDIAADVGEPVYAVADGEVIYLETGYAATATW